MKLLAFFLAINLSANELTKETLIPKEKNFVYGSLSLAPGAGLSMRSRTDLQGRALDFKLGAVPFFQFVGTIPVITVDYNWVYYFKTLEASPYLSAGAGAVWGIGSPIVLPYVPLRGGLEYKYGFIDIGVKTLIFPAPIPIPEVRAGLNISF